MRLLFAAILLGWWAASVPAGAQDHPLQTFTGTASQSTGLFQVGNDWEARFDSPDFLTVTVLDPQGRIVSRVSGAGKISLFQPQGGSFYLHIDRSGSGAPIAPWQISIVGTALPPDGNSSVAAAESTKAPASAAPVAPVFRPSIPPAGGLSDEEARAVVLIKGDAGEGTGFLARTSAGPVVFTNLHVLSANPNWKIYTGTGEQIKTIGLQGASDRDIARFLIQDDHYSYLDLATDIDGTVQIGDATIIPGNSEGGEVMLDTKGSVLGVGPDKIEFSNPIYHGNSGGPVFHLKSRKVIAVVEGAFRVKPTDELDRASLANSNSAIAGSMRYFGLRTDTVPTWETYDENRFLSETLFIKSFHDRSRALDSYLNGEHYEKANLTSQNPEEGMPNSKFYLTDPQIRTATEDYRHMVAGGERSLTVYALQVLTVELQKQADEGLAVMENSANFYSYDRVRAKQEVQYRLALKGELQNLGNRVDDLVH